jgi:predicted MFS family arabinose efflux permease
VTPLVLLFALAFLVTVDLRILAPVLPSIAASLEASPGTVGLAMTSYTLAYGTGQLVYGPLSDRLGRIAVVRAAGVGFVVTSALSALAGTPWQFIALRFLVGVFAGAVIPLALVYIGDTVPYAGRQIVIGRFSVITSGALAFSASIGGLVAHFVSWRLMLVGYGLLAAAPVACMWRLGPQPAPRRPAAAAAAGFAACLADPRARLVYLAVFLEGALLWGGVTYLGAFATRRYGLDQLAVGLLLALFGVGIMTGGLLMEPVRRRCSEAGLATGGGALMGMSFLALVPAGPTWVFAVSMPLLGFGFLGLHSTLQLRGTEISSTARGTAFALFAFSLFVGMAAGTAALGPLVDAGRYEVVFIIAGTGLAGIGLFTARSGSHT